MNLELGDRMRPGNTERDQGKVSPPVCIGDGPSFC